MRNERTRAWLGLVLAAVLAGPAVAAPGPTLPGGVLQRAPARPGDPASGEVDGGRRAVEDRIAARTQALLERIWAPGVGICLLFLVVAVRLIRRRWGAALASPAGVYPGLAAWLFAAFFLLTAMGCGSLFLAGFRSIAPRLSVPLTSAAAQAASLVLGLALHRAVLRRPFQPFGGEGGRAAGRAVALAIVLYAAQLPAFYGFLALAAQVFPRKFQEQVVQIAVNRDALFRGLFFLSVAVLAPLFEEVVFRGLILNVLRRHLGVAGGIALSALLFMLVHPVQTYLPIFWLGIVLGFAYHYTGGLLAPIAMHAIHNAVQFGLVVWAASGG